MILHKLWSYSVMLAGAWLVFKQLGRAGQDDVLVGVIIVVPFFLFYAIPMVVFGASVHAKEQFLLVRQYFEAEIPYSQVLRCFGLLLPPFDVAVIITTRRFPMCFLVGANGTVAKRGDLVDQIQKRMREGRLRT